MVYISNDAYTVKLEWLVPCWSFESISNLDEVQLKKLDNAGETWVLDDMHHLESDTAVLRASVSDCNSAKSVLVC